MNRTRKRRGTIIVCFAAIMMVTGVMCSLVLVRSLEGFGSSKRLESRLQALAAAEGAARLAIGGSVDTPVRIGNCTASVHSVDGTPNERPITVTVHAVTGAEVFRASYIARYSTDSSGALALAEVVHP